jgi:tRNA uridine 5-carboxymethylaminomethyl modification enzyme
VQYKALRSVPGFENMKMFRPGYAIEYDFFPPTQLDISLETKLVENLYFAGQINGTTGYEEAACQGLIAGLNAHLKINEKDPFVLKRSEAYIGVLIDDLVNKGTKEPYRMFTSRAEYRILLRQDNADIRLTPLAQKLGMHGLKERMERVHTKLENVKNITKYLEKESIAPEEINFWLSSISSSPLKQKVKMVSILGRPNIDLEMMKREIPRLNEKLKAYDLESQMIAQVGLKYQGYIAKEKELADKLERLETVHLHKDFDYQQITSISAEAREKLSKIKPRTIGQASRISGVTPADVSILLVHVGR